MHYRESKSGFTIIELLVASMLFVFLALSAISIFMYILHMQRDINTQKKLQDETRFLVEKIVKEFRNGTIDYAEYFLQNDVYSDLTYADYEALPADGSTPPYTGDNGNVSSLYILYPGGNERAVFAQRGKDGCTESCSDFDLTFTQERYDKDTGEWKEVSWVWDQDSASFALREGNGTEVLNSTKVSMKSLHFKIAPGKDPFKFYDDSAVQHHPMLTIVIETVYNDNTLDVDPVTVQTSVSARMYRHIRWK